ncbi:MAG: hypothetical protein ACOYNC_15935 [Bacteroidales bacterium]
MKKNVFLILLVVTGVLSSFTRGYAQKTSGSIAAVEKCLRDYQDLSSLGNPNSVYIDSATIGAFRDLFELNANHCWDLDKRKNTHTSAIVLIPVNEYVDSVTAGYKGFKPLVSFGKRDVRINPDGKSATVYLVKFNAISNEESTQKQKFTRNISKLRILVNIHDDEALIQNVSLDTRYTRIRSISLEGGYSFMNRVTGNFLGHPESAIDPAVTAGYSVKNAGGYHAGINADIRLVKQKADGLVLNAGLLYSVTNFDLTIHNYANTYRQAFTSCEKPYECTVVDQAPVVQEKMSLTGISIPVTVKWYVPKKSAVKYGKNKNDLTKSLKKSKQPVRLNFYLKGGFQATLVSGNTTTYYILTEKSKGKFVYLEPGNQADSTSWFYLDDAHAITVFADKMFDYSATLKLKKVYVSAILAIGIEAKFNNITIGIEPWLNVGITSISGRDGNPVYNLHSPGQFDGFINTLNAPKVNSLGMSVVIGKLFTKKH